jgi:hypothetical protein
MKYNLPVHYLLISVALFSFSCASSKQGTPSFAKLPPQVAPSHCRLVGTIVSIDTTRSPNPQDPCAKAPCKAKVKITKILGYGAGFTSPLAEGREVEMTFTFTLAPTTKDLFPNLIATYPGLKTGDTFQADIQAQVKMGEEKPSLVVMGYEVK